MTTTDSFPKASIDAEPAGDWVGAECEVPAHLQEIIHLRAALTNRDDIGQAKGIIRLLTSTDSQNAFTVLAKMSQDCNRKVYDVAVQITQCAATGTPLPPEMATSWKRRTGTPAVGDNHDAAA